MKAPHRAEYPFVYVFDRNDNMYKLEGTASGVDPTNP